MVFSWYRTWARWFVVAWVYSLVLGTASTVEAGGQVALTFDDGPRPFFTEKALDLFDRYDASVTFFYVGQMLTLYPQLAKLAAARGHEIENHTFDHPKLTRLSRAEVQAQILRTSTLIAQQTGSRPRYVRPPYNAINQTVLDVGEKLGIKFVQWTIDPQDWQHKRSSATIVRHVMDRVQNGSIVLLHETPGTLRALPDLLSQLQKRGFTMVTVAELWSHAVPKPTPPVPPSPPSPVRPDRPSPPSMLAPEPRPGLFLTQDPLLLPHQDLVLDRSSRPVVRILCGKGGTDEVELSPDYSYQLLRGARADNSLKEAGSGLLPWAWQDEEEIQFRLTVPPGIAGAVNVFLEEDPRSRWGQELLIDHRYVGKYRGSRWVGLALDEVTTEDGCVLVQVLGIGAPAQVREVVFEVEESLPLIGDTVAALPSEVPPTRLSDSCYGAPTSVSKP